MGVIRQTFQKLKVMRLQWMKFSLKWGLKKIISEAQGGSGHRKTHPPVLGTDRTEQQSSIPAAQISWPNLLLMWCYAAEQTSRPLAIGTSQRTAPGVVLYLSGRKDDIRHTMANLCSHCLHMWPNHFTMPSCADTGLSEECSFKTIPAHCLLTISVCFVQQRGCVRHLLMQFVAENSGHIQIWACAAAAVVTWLQAARRSTYPAALQRWPHLKNCQIHLKKVVSWYR